jgi:hypothetical protein
MTTFQIIRFDVLNLQTVLAECRRRGIDDYRTIAVAFNLWQREFARKAYLFYRAQYMQHYNRLWDQFCRGHGITPGDGIAEWQENAWSRWQEEEDLCDHSRFLQEQQALLERYELTYLSDSYANQDHLLRDSPINFDALWFNSTIRTAPQQQMALQALAYDIYLTTLHWRRVRSAMLLVYQAACQSDDCPSMGESLYGEEPTLHVHHLSYDNVGCERYEDLTLLCKDCHLALHEK